MNFRWIFYCVNAYYLHIDIRFTDYSVLHQQNSQSKNNNISGSHFTPCPLWTSVHLTSWRVISLETSTAHRPFLGQAFPCCHWLGFWSSWQTNLVKPSPLALNFWSPSQPAPFPLKVKAVGSQASCLVTLGELQAGTGVRRCLCKTTCRMILGCWILISEARKLWGTCFLSWEKWEAKVTWREVGFPV